MLTIEDLKELGVDTEGGLIRCSNNEEFYLRMVELALQSDNYDVLHSAIESGDLDKAFQTAFALKGIMGNLGIIQISNPIDTITEELRFHRDIDYSDYIDTIFSELEKLRALM